MTTRLFGLPSARSDPWRPLAARMRPDALDILADCLLDGLADCPVVCLAVCLPERLAGAPPAGFRLDAP